MCFRGSSSTSPDCVSLSGIILIIEKLGLKLHSSEDHDARRGHTSGVVKTTSSNFMMYPLLVHI